jgi:hypothetical protein
MDGFCQLENEHWSSMKSGKFSSPAEWSRSMDKFSLFAYTSITCFCYVSKIRKLHGLGIWETRNDAARLGWGGSLLESKKVNEKIILKFSLSIKTTCEISNWIILALIGVNGLSWVSASVKLWCSDQENICSQCMWWDYHCWIFMY